MVSAAVAAGVMAKHTVDVNVGEASLVLVGPANDAGVGEPKTATGRLTARVDLDQLSHKITLLAALACLAVSLVMTYGHMLVLPEYRPQRNLRGTGTHDQMKVILASMMPPIPNIVHPQQSLVNHAKMLPTSDEISGMKQTDLVMRNQYFRSYYVLVLLVHLVALEMFRLLWNLKVARACKSRISPVVDAHQYTSASSKEDEPMTEQPLTTGGLSSFVFYHIHYNYGCIFLVGYGWWTERVSGNTGLDWELYAPWLYFVMLAQWVCLMAKLVTSPGPIASVGFRCFLSFVPGTSDKLNVLKDAITTAIYATHGAGFGYMLAFASILTIILPDMMVYRSHELVSDMMISYLDPYLDPAKSECSDPSLPRLVKMKRAVIHQCAELTSPLKRMMGRCEGVPQAIIAVAFVVAYGLEGSLFVVVMAAIQVTQIIVIHIARPYILCILAAEGSSWSMMSRDDVRAAFLIKSKIFPMTTAPETRFKAGKDLLLAGSDPAVKATLLEAIPVFVQQNLMEMANQQGQEARKEAIEGIVLAKDASLEIELVKTALLSLGADEGTVKQHEQEMAEYNREQGEILENLRQVEEEKERLAKNVTELKESQDEFEAQTQQLNEQKTATIERLDAELPRMRRGQSNEFWMWGQWGKTRIKAPFFTSKFPDKNIRKIVIGSAFILGLEDDGIVLAWGEDKTGCLGLSCDITQSAEPRQVVFPNESGKVIDIQLGNRHLLALTDVGKVYAWGGNSLGQLGQNDKCDRFEAVEVGPKGGWQKVVEILAVEDASYALTCEGSVYAWGDNREGKLALSHERPIVMEPECMTRLENTHVKHIEVKDNIFLAFTERAVPVLQLGE